MSDEIRFEATPETEGLCSLQPTIIVDVVVRHHPPGTPARVRSDRPHLPRGDEKLPPGDALPRK